VHFCVCFFLCVLDFKNKDILYMKK
jgi:hypothetical protein